MLNFRNKKKIIKNKNNRTATDEHDIVMLLPFYTDLGSLRPVDYRMPPVLVDFYTNLDDTVNALLARTNFDDLNDGSFYDKHIDKILEITKDDLYKQKQSHIHVIAEIRSIEQTRLHEIQQKEAEIQEKLKDYDEGGNLK